MAILAPEIIIEIILFLDIKTLLIFLLSDKNNKRLYDNNHGYIYKQKLINSIDYIIDIEKSYETYIQLFSCGRFSITSNKVIFTNSIKKNLLEAVKYCFEKGFNNLIYREFPFYHSIYFGNLDILKFLLEDDSPPSNIIYYFDYDYDLTYIKGFKFDEEYDIFYINDHLYTGGLLEPSCEEFILHMSSYNGYLDIVKYIIQNYPKLSELTKTRALKCSVYNNHLLIIDYLIDNGAKIIDKVVCRAIEGGNLILAKNLLDKLIDNQ